MGLASTAPALLRAVRAENDPAVLGALSCAPQQHGSGNLRPPVGIVELRLWARAYAEKHPELRRSSAAAPLLPGVAGAVPPPSLDPSRANEFRTRQDQVPDLPDDEPASPAPLAEDLERMGPVRVMVTGAGGPAGVAVIRALYARGHHVIALDADPSAVGLRLASEHHVVPRADDPHYLAALLRVATISDAQALICTVAEEYRALSGAHDYLLEAGLRTLHATAGCRRDVHRQVGVLHPAQRRGLPGAGDRAGQLPKASPARGSSSRGSAAARVT